MKNVGTRGESVSAKGTVDPEQEYNWVECQCELSNTITQGIASTVVYTSS